MMCNKNRLTNLALMMACAITFSLLVAVGASAKTVNSVDSTKVIGVKISAAANSRLLDVLRRAAKANPKLAKVLTSRCGCAPVAPDDQASFGSCFSNCLKDVGISPYGLIMCGTACAAAATGAGAIVCAICVGVSVTVVEVCALGCLAYPDGTGKREGTIMAKNLKQNPSRHKPSQGPKLKLVSVRT